MKFLKITLVIVVMLVNLVIAQPSWADRPKFSKNPDYIEVTKALEKLQKNAEVTIPEDVQRQIDELQLQKAAIESGVTWGQCSNKTGETLAIYGPLGEKSKSSYDNQLYFLANDQTTPDGWDCQGVYLPSDVKVAGLENTGATAVQITDGTQLLVKKNSETSEWEFNVPSAKVVNPDKMNWFIPNVSQTFVDSRIPSTLTSEESD
ncbi:hypothetical protein [Brasilonema sp. UFV-L1]|uniref:hypothetical protein n=1 Tax=Brasilonema sp. UFV-L1 TaxID=2234130 RepID=UPI00145E8FA5|nr:hypothetical protein [Brasilonema sp. UFV-L1]NMG05667.1 hypothetical protein [Brasilonema sp. UFV-L1]